VSWRVGWRVLWSENGQEFPTQASRLRSFGQTDPQAGNR
jgi:hypothetical protein